MKKQSFVSCHDVFLQSINEIYKMNDCISNNVFLNNNIVPLTTALPEIFNGETTVYEVIRIINGYPLFIEDHLERLEKSATLLGVTLLFSIQEMKEKMTAFIKRESIVLGNIRLQYIFKDTKSMFLLYQSQHSYPTKDQYITGVTTKTLSIVRDNPNAKNIQSFHSVAQLFIKSHQLYEAILVDYDGNITEGSKSNLFFIEGKSILTALPTDVLLGITRKYVIEACHLLGLHVEERKISKNELPNFDAAFISGTSPKILPIQSIDANVYKTNNVLLQQLMNKLDELIQQNIDKQKNN